MLWWCVSYQSKVGLGDTAVLEAAIGPAGCSLAQSHTESSTGGEVQLVAEPAGDRRVRSTRPRRTQGPTDTGRLQKKGTLHQRIGLRTVSFCISHQIVISVSGGNFNLGVTSIHLTEAFPAAGQSDEAGKHYAVLKITSTVKTPFPAPTHTPRAHTHTHQIGRAHV